MQCEKQHFHEDCQWQVTCMCSYFHGHDFIFGLVLTVESKNHTRHGVSMFGAILVFEGFVQHSV